MPNLETSDRKQRVVYWARSGTDGYGEPTLSARIELYARIERKLREVLGPTGQTILSDVRLVVDREVPLHSIVWLGALQDLPSPVSGVDLYEVIAYREIPDLRGRSFRRTVDLIRYSQQLPSLA